VLVGTLAVVLNLLWLALVDPHQVVPGPMLRLQYFIKLGLYGLGVTVLGTLNEQRHQPSRQRGTAMPI
jgi:hypothetical protein